MPQLKGLILAGSCSHEDELVQRLSGRLRYGMPVANRSLVRYGVEALIGAGIGELIVAVSAGTVAEVGGLLGGGEQYGARFLYLEHSAAAGAAEIIAQARELTGACELVVHRGDALVPEGLGAALSAFRARKSDALLVGDHGTAPAPARALVTARPEAEPAGAERHLAVRFPAAVLAEPTLSLLREAGAETVERAAAGSGAELGDLAGALAEAAVAVSGYTVPDCWCFAGDAEHLLQANRAVLDALPHEDHGRKLAEVRLEGRVAIHPSAELERTTIRGPAVIGSGARLSDTFVGPYTSIGAGAVLEGAEIDNSIVMPGAWLRHLGRRIEASLIGVGASVSRDFVMPSAVRLTLGARSDVMLS